MKFGDQAGEGAQRPKGSSEDHHQGRKKQFGEGLSRTRTEGVKDVRRWTGLRMAEDGGRFFSFGVLKDSGRGSKKNRMGLHGVPGKSAASGAPPGNLRRGKNGGNKACELGIVLTEKTRA